MVLRLRIVVSCACAAGLAGCATIGAAPTRTAASAVQRTHEQPSPRPAAQTAANGSVSPLQAVRAFATLYINWTPEDVSRHMSQLAAQSIGQARSAMELAAAQTRQDYELRRGGISNSGSVQAVAALLGSRYRYAVVTRERTTSSDSSAYQGLAPAWHVAIATVAQLSGGHWVLSGWQPES